ncbi:hypothetical protein Dimus_031807, partial [Dionaea muscipula]
WSITQSRAHVMAMAKTSAAGSAGSVVAVDVTCGTARKGRDGEEVRGASQWRRSERGNGQHAVAVANTARRVAWSSSSRFQQRAQLRSSSNRDSRAHTRSREQR